MQINADLKLRKSDRLLNKSEFDLVFSKPDQKLGNRYFFILTKNNQIDSPRMGVIVPKRNVKQAVKRNLIKRIIKESFRLNKNRLNHIDIVVLVNKSINDLLEDKKSIRKNIDLLWEKLKTQ